MFEHYNHLGFFSPYVRRNDNDKLLLSHDVKDFLKTSSQLSIDVPSVIEILSRGFSFHNRTILKEIKKSPWLAQPNSEQTGWIYYDLPNHGNNFPNQENIINELAKRLKNELKNYINDSKSIGILLSGGMDSRITAGFLKQVIKENNLNCEVLAITWGTEESRDVLYANKIAKIYNWDWLHFDITPEMLNENIEITADMLCEFAPFHLHAMKEVSQIDGLDCILASSFGDSIGRGVYSSRHLLDLTSFKLYLRNWYRLLEKNSYKSNISNCYSDLEYYRTNFPRDKGWQNYEIERQAIYMRRLLNPCLALINKKIPVCQTFSAPEVYSYMWSINPNLRNDEIYELIIREKLSELKHIPWSKTGIPFNQSNSKYKSDDLSKDYHNYPLWIRTDLFQIIQKLCLSSEIEGTNLFNLSALEKLLAFNRKLKVNKMTHIDSFSIWLASFAKLLKKNPNIQTEVTSQKFGNPIISTFEYSFTTLAQSVRKKIKS